MAIIETTCGLCGCETHGVEGKNAVCTLCSGTGKKLHIEEIDNAAINASGCVDINKLLNKKRG